ncbi:MAG: hypothetical protein U9N07_07550 [Euryarchaeota archaeon]|nr:hypothetical protein [Euryarchaeota archaeon]
MTVAAGIGTFDTSSGTYPSICGTHTNNFTPERNITVSKMYTHPCEGTGGHSEYVAFYENGEEIANGTWSGYLGGDYYNIVFGTLFTSCGCDLQLCDRNGFLSTDHQRHNPRCNSNRDE